MSYFVLNPEAIDEIVHGPDATTYLEDEGGRVRDAAKAMAPVLTGRGEASIHYEVVDGAVNISWGAEAGYLIYSELGDSRQPARPFLRPALGAA